jgi:hypothetical protein
VISLVKKALIITEQCQKKGKQVPSPLKYTDKNILLIDLFEIDTMNNAREKGNISHHH